LRAFWRYFLVFVFIFSVVVIAEARFDSLDGLTVREPMPVRTLVGHLALREYGTDDNYLERVLKIDPNNARAWERRCTALLGATQSDWISDCQHALKLEATGTNYRLMGSAQEQANEFCAAQASYHTALSKPDIAGVRPHLLRDEARAALACGDPATSLAVLHTAEEIDESTAGNVAAPGEINSARDGLASDYGYMAVVYDHINQPEKAREMCSEAYPGSETCNCQLTGTGLVCSHGAQQSLLR
jgi:tetratricopeptide (TPR) repeat protein